MYTGPDLNILTPEENKKYTPISENFREMTKIFSLSPLVRTNIILLDRQPQSKRDKIPATVAATGISTAYLFVHFKTVLLLVFKLKIINYTILINVN